MRAPERPPGCLLLQGWAAVGSPRLSRSPLGGILSPLAAGPRKEPGAGSTRRGAGAPSWLCSELRSDVRGLSGAEYIYLLCSWL